MTKTNKEQTDPIKQMNKKIIDKVKAWQEFPYVKPLRCKREGCGELLVPVEKKNKVVLQCPKCKNVQPYVPKSIIDANVYSTSPTLERNKQRYGRVYGDDSE